MPGSFEREIGPGTGRRLWAPASASTRQAMDVAGRYSHLLGLHPGVTCAAQAVRGGLGPGGRRCLGEPTGLSGRTGRMELSPERRKL
ncbi:hypothetical protein AJ78_07683 [Emergomyces pasteurianus Ep9510]|uniref:Uncharacterized protein n=1 Tax=Emergomyces pasteurianus Ep9510 TaxID=1447872 RepID=A0A1J9Q8R8_9EURO|nr:hypothetical protein AJ78_07683 [Emergomyces pasteurianus Ep9510]